MVDFSIFLGGQAGEGIKRGARTIGKLFNRLGYYVFILDDYMSLIRGGQDYSEIRVSKNRVFSHKDNFDIVFAFHDDVYQMNKEKTNKNCLTFIQGNEDFNIDFESIIKNLKAPSFMKPSIVLGMIACIADINFEIVKKLLEDEFRSNASQNIDLAQKGYDLAYEKNLPKQPLFENEKIDLPLIYGNDAIGIGAIKAGMKIYIAYPITPSSTLLSFLARNAQKFNIAVVHPEDEIAAVMMAIGSAYAGIPSMVGTSGAGIDLMGEAISLSGGAEIPLVILDVERPGPTTGVPTYTEQSDLNLVLNVGHGEFPRIVIAPGDIDEAFEYTKKAFQYAWWYQIPVIVLSDKHLSESAANTKISMDKQETLSVKHFKEGFTYKRYEITEDGISPLAFPGYEGIVNHTNSTEHTEDGYSSSSANDIKLMKEKRLKKKLTIEKDFESEPTCKFYGDSSAINLIVSFGSTKGAIIESIQNLPVKFIQIICLDPFPMKKLETLCNGDENIIVVEQNTFGQLTSLFESKMHKKVNHKILKYDGRPFDPKTLRDNIKELLI
ncbi:MAG: 2-oxoacid:acceptor oxidoreductase subunit alpha [Candidatus Micrarchaeaceae archaeon]